MAPGAASTVTQYLASLPPDRRAAIARVRDVVNARLPAGYEEMLQYGMISWVVPPSRLSHTYNGQALALASLGSQKHYMALYMMSVYGDAELATWFADAYRASGKKLDMGKSCVRFKTLEQLPLDVIGEAISRVPVDAYVAFYEANRARSVAPKPVATAKPAKRAVATAKATKRAVAKRAKATKRAAAKPAKATKATKRAVAKATKRVSARKA